MKILNQIFAAAPRLPAASDVALVNVLPTFGINPPEPAVSIPVSMTDRAIYNDPRELWYLSFGANKLTQQQVLQILRSALGGDIWQQWQLCAMMLDDWPTFRKAAHELMEGAAYMRYAVHPYADEGSKPSKQAQEKADLVSRAMRGMNPMPFNDEKGFSGMAYTLCDAVLNGISIVELLWERRTSSNHGREWMPKSAAWVHPRHFTFTNDGYISIFGENYNRLLWPMKDAPDAHVPDERKFLCAQFLSRAGSSIGSGLMRPLGWAWSARKFNCEWMLNTAKQYGAPFLDITYKPGQFSTNPSDPNSDLNKLDAMAKNAGAQRRLIHPEGSTVEVTAAASLGKENPQRVLEEKADEWALFLLLGQKGTTTPTAGKLGNEDTHENVKNERILGVANWLARNPLRQFARAVLMMNYGECTECPEIVPDTTKPLKPEQVGSLSTAVRSSGLPVRADEFYKKTGFTQPEAGEVVFQDGKLLVHEDPMTHDEMFERQLEQQAAQTELAQAMSPNRARQTKPLSAVKASWKQKLSRADGETLDELEKLVTAAERATHFNGEANAVKAALEKLN